MHFDRCSLESSRALLVIYEISRQKGARRLAKREDDLKQRETDVHQTVMPRYCYLLKVSKGRLCSLDLLIITPSVISVSKIKIMPLK